MPDARYLFLLVCLVVLLRCFSAGPINTTSDVTVSDQLVVAVQRADRDTAVRLVERVLSDALARSYRYSYETRKNAADAVSELRLTEVTTLLREVAELVPAPSDPERFLDTVIASAALQSLTLLRDAEAARLNMKALAQPSLSATAILNLETLRHWEATEDVRKLVAETKSAPEDMLAVVAGLRFPRNSPLAVRSDCSLVERLTCTHPAVCRDYRAAVHGLMERFQCGMSAPSAADRVTGSSGRRRRGGDYSGARIRDVETFA